jgi:hypothetical protein
MQGSAEGNLHLGRSKKKMSCPTKIVIPKTSLSMFSLSINLAQELVSRLETNSEFTLT